MSGDTTYNDDLPKFDQYDDDYVLQTEANLVEQSTVGIWEECSKESAMEEMNDTNPFSDPEVLPLSHLQNTESEIDEDSTHLGSSPLCFNAFHIMMGNWHPEDLSE